MLWKEEITRLLKNIKNNLSKASKRMKVPTYKELDMIADFFKANRNWLKYGKEYPFFNVETYRDAFEEIIELKPKIVFPLLEKENENRASMVLKLSDYYYKVIKLGAELNANLFKGKHLCNLESLCAVIEKLFSLHRKTNLRIECREVSSEVFDNIYWGHSYPGIVENLTKSGISNSYWAEDLVDLLHKYPIAKGCHRMYPYCFVPVQKAVKNYRDERGEKRREVSAEEVGKFLGL